MGEHQEIRLPDVGDFEDVDVAEILVAAGDEVAAETSLIVLESDKATMEIPSPWAGVIVELKVAVGDKLSQGDLIALIEVAEAGTTQSPESDDTAPTGAAESEAGERAAEAAAPAASPAASPEIPAAPSVATPPPAPRGAEAPQRPRTTLPLADEEGTEVIPAAAELVPAGEASAHASPSVRRLARELGADLRLVPGSGPKGRILKEDVQGYVKGMIAKGTASGVPIAGVAVAAALKFDFSAYGPVESQPLNRIRKLSAANLHRSWVTVPHVTQFDEADVTELDAFRHQMKPEAEARGVKLTFLPFVLKACAHVLGEFPQFNASLDHTGEHLILKRYFHIGVAVDTPNGLVVPVVHDADQKGLYEIAEQLMEISQKARDRKLRPGDLRGASFSISSLGGIGGTFFTPIVNHPEVAILGVGRMEWRPVHQQGEFVARLILPLSLSYDHRVVDGADAARFTTRLGELLADMRRLIL
ncbi:MAG: dihydrolipoyllysine-residue acetyltransferase [Myxococcales bacterium]|nr:dihydrolipoyllysine-residue acetyltransferase [Myxococcales bacterium]